MIPQDRVLFCGILNQRRLKGPQKEDDLSPTSTLFSLFPHSLGKQIIYARPLIHHSKAENPEMLLCESLLSSWRRSHDGCLALYWEEGMLHGKLRRSCVASPGLYLQLHHSRTPFLYNHMPTFCPLSIKPRHKNPVFSGSLDLDFWRLVGYIQLWINRFVMFFSCSSVLLQRLVMDFVMDNREALCHFVSTTD